MPRTKAEVDSEQAQSAWQRGVDLLAAGDAAAALAWLDRADRIAPGDEMVALTRAQALFTLGDATAAAEMFERLSCTVDVREVWLGLAAARLSAGQPEAAARALAAALAGHRLIADAAFVSVADGIAARAGMPGWCGLGQDEALLIRRVGAADAAIVVTADAAVLADAAVPAGTGRVEATCAGRHLLGSPVLPRAIRRVEGFVAARRGGLEGWAWLPGDAARDPVLALSAAHGGAARRIVAADHGMRVLRPLTRPRRFRLSAADLAGLEGMLHVQGADGRDLAGSPLDPGQEIRAAADAAAAVARALPVAGDGEPGGIPWLPVPADLPPPPGRAAPRRPRRRAAVVIPAYRGAAMTLACLDSVFATVPAGTTVIVVDDASPEPELSDALARLAARRRIRLIRHARNQGFPAAANAGLRAASLLPGPPDVVLLNSDTVVTDGWLARLRDVVHAAGDIGTACPLSNDATILSYPDPAKPSAPLQGAALAALAALAGEVHGAAAVEVPTAVGFCMYIRRECLDQTGLLRCDVFGQGYGEENDFCLRARHLGWRHVAAPGAYVAHAGGASFGDARSALQARNLDVLERLHPGYRAMISAWHDQDALAAPRRALDAARWARRQGPPGGTMLLVTHDSGGGVERAIRARCAALAGRGIGAIVLRPLVDPAGTAARRYLPGLCRVSDGVDAVFANLVYRLPDELPLLVALLAADRPAWLEIHHLLGHHPSVATLAPALNIPTDLRVHDYSLICPQINLVGVDRRYCGEPALSVCAACVADIGRALEEEITPAALRERSQAAVAAARSVIVPSEDTARRLRRHFPALRPLVAPHEDDAGLPAPQPLVPAMPGKPRRIGIIGAIGVAKGYDTLLACARDCARRDLALTFVVVGHTQDDERLLATGRAFITGPYSEADAVAVIRRQRLHLAWLPSIWPETWCYTLGEAMRAGLGAAVFDIGAQAERIAATGRGWTLPLGLPAPAINNALLALHTIARDECPRPSDAAVSNGSVSNHQRSKTARS